MEQVHVLRIIVASPGDGQAERDVLPVVLEELTRGIAAEHGLRLELGRWETDAYPGFHPQGPQGLIDPSLRIEDCDVLLGIFHIPSLLVVERIIAHRKPPDVRICRLRNQSRVGTVPPSTSTPHCPACWARRW